MATSESAPEATADQADQQNTKTKTTSDAEQQSKDAAKVEEAATIVKQSRKRTKSGCLSKTLISSSAA